jgi:lysophospholipase L1-like esterase
MVTVALGGATALIAPGQALAATPNGEYVALGDSYTSGPLIPPSVAPACGRSGANYPSLVKQKLGSTPFKDMSCAGAVIQNVLGSQIGALSANTKLVTVSIGGNDIGFASIVYGCAARSQYNTPGAPCRDQLSAGGGDALAAKVAAVGPRLLSLYQTIKTRAPNAKVLVIGYPTIFSPNTCPGGLSAEDSEFLVKNNFGGIDQEMQKRAQAAGATYVDTATSSTGHGICAPVADRWVENRTPTHPAAPWHPNEMSMTNTANQIVAALGSSS